MLGKACMIYELLLIQYLEQLWIIMIWFLQVMVIYDNYLM